MIVVDVNILLYHEIDGPMTPLTKQLLAKDAEWLTSTLWSFEFLNALATMTRASILKIDRALEILHAANAAYGTAQLAIPEEEVLRTAHQYRISAYDAQYVTLAEWLQVPCVTADAPLVRKASPVAVLLADFVK